MTPNCPDERTMFGLPKVKGGGCEKTDALRYPFNLAATEPLKAALCPLLLGRNTLLPEAEVFCVVGDSGKPDASAGVLHRSL
jgi:hypothetical protein